MTGAVYRQPLEAEWVYAACAWMTAVDDFSKSFSREYSEFRNALDRPQTVPVGSLPANPWGLHEMHTNVLEWCVDGILRCGRQLPRESTDPIGSLDSVGRTVRGGSWMNKPDNETSLAFGREFSLDYLCSNIGFRVVQEQESSKVSGVLLGRAPAHRALLIGKRALALLKEHGGYRWVGASRSEWCEVALVPALRKIIDEIDYPPNPSLLASPGCFKIVIDMWGTLSIIRYVAGKDEPVKVLMMSATEPVSWSRGIRSNWYEGQFDDPIFERDIDWRREADLVEWQIELFLPDDWEASFLEACDRVPASALKYPKSYYQDVER